MNTEWLRQYCLSLPAVTEDVKWDNDLCFLVGGKMFCVTSLDPPLKVSFKVRDEDFEELSSRQYFIPAPYMARAKWVQVTRPSVLSRNEWEDCLLTSYELVKDRLTIRERKRLGIDK